MVIAIGIRVHSMRGTVDGTVLGRPELTKRLDFGVQTLTLAKSLSVSDYNHFVFGLDDSA